MTKTLHHASISILTALLLCALTYVALLSGCAPQPRDDSGSVILPAGVPARAVTREHGQVRDYHLQDGTRCVVIYTHSHTGVSIDCDWKCPNDH